MKQLPAILILIFLSVSCKKKGTAPVKKEPGTTLAVKGLKSYPGRNRIKLEWQLGTDVNTAKYRVYWNNKKDSLEAAVLPDKTSASITINGLEEGLYEFSVAEIAGNGHITASSNIKERAYGTKYEDSLSNRSIKAIDFNESSNTLTVKWENAASGTYRTEIKYTGISGKEYKLQLPAISGSISLTDFKPEGIAAYRTLYFPKPAAIDTFYTSFDSLEVPKPEPKILWNGDASLGNDIWKAARNIDGNGTITIEDDVTYGLAWKFYKPLGSHRTESHAASGFQAKEGDDIYIGWRSKLSMPPNIQTNAVFQWKAYGADMQQNFPIVFKTTSDGNLQLLHYAPGKIETEVWKTSLKINMWNRFVLRLKVSRDGDIGFMELWYNGIKQNFTGGSQRYYGRTLDADYCDPKWGVYGGDPQEISNYVSGLRIASTVDLAMPQKLSEPEPDPIPGPAPEPVDPPNLMLNKKVTASSELSSAKASYAVDDDLETEYSGESTPPVPDESTPVKRPIICAAAPLGFQS